MEGGELEELGMEMYRSEIDSWGAARISSSSDNSDSEIQIQSARPLLMRFVELQSALISFNVGRTGSYQCPRSLRSRMCRLGWDLVALDRALGLRLLRVGPCWRKDGELRFDCAKSVMGQRKEGCMMWSLLLYGSC